LANRWLDRNELEELFWFGECVEAFYNNRFFRSFWDYLRRTDEDIFSFFEALLALCRKKNFFDLAATQELMSSLVLELTEGRPDKELLRELLIFDWLRCGPGCVAAIIFCRLTLSRSRSRNIRKISGSRCPRTGQVSTIIKAGMSFSNRTFLSLFLKNCCRK
jgi:hypothetical protein